MVRITQTQGRHGHWETVGRSGHDWACSLCLCLNDGCCARSDGKNLADIEMIKKKYKTLNENPRHAVSLNEC